MLIFMLCEAVLGIWEDTTQRFGFGQVHTKLQVFTTCGRGILVHHAQEGIHAFYCLLVDKFIAAEHQFLRWLIRLHVMRIILRRNAKKHFHTTTSVLPWSLQAE